MPVACTSAGRVLLQEATPDELYVRFGVEGSLPALWTRIQEARRTGYASVRDEFEDGLCGVSAPIWDFRGRVIAALNISAPTARLGDRLDGAGHVTAQAAGQVSRQLGWGDRAQAPVAGSGHVG